MITSKERRNKLHIKIDKLIDNIVAGFNLAMQEVIEDQEKEMDLPQTKQFVVKPYKRKASKETTAA